MSLARWASLGRGWSGARGLSGLVVQAPDVPVEFAAGAKQRAAWLRKEAAEKERRKRVAQAVLKNISIGQRKLNEVCKLIRGRTVKDAMGQLLSGTKRKVRYEVYGTLTSAVKNGTDTLGLDPSRLVVSEAYVAKGRYKKVMHYHAKGKGAIGHKYYSHLTVRVSEMTPEKWQTERPGARYVHRQFRPPSAARAAIPDNLVRPWEVKSQLDINVQQSAHLL